MTVTEAANGFQTQVAAEWTTKYCSYPGGTSLLVGNGGQTLFEFAERCQVYLWVRCLVHDRCIYGAADEKI